MNFKIETRGTKFSKREEKKTEIIMIAPKMHCFAMFYDLWSRYYIEKLLKVAGRKSE